MRASTRKLILTFHVLLALGCGGLGPRPKASDSGLPPGVVSDFLNQYFPLLCQNYLACHLAPSIDSCRADLLATWRPTISLLLGDINRGWIVFDEDAANACLGSVVSKPCLSASNGDFLAGLRCPGVFRGAVAIGETCVYDVECATGHCKAAKDPSTGDCARPCCAGTCVALADIGSSCSDISDSSDCTANGYCALDVSDFTVTRACRARSAQGEACKSELEPPCQAGLTCDDQNTLTCMPYPKDGQPCSGVPCDNFDSFCDPTTGTCQARLDVGAPCTDLGCVIYAQCLYGTCTVLPSAGDACTVPDSGPPYGICRWDATLCVDGICQEPVRRPLCTIEDVEQQDAGTPPPD